MSEALVLVTRTDVYMYMYIYVVGLLDTNTPVSQIHITDNNVTVVFINTAYKLFEAVQNHQGVLTGINQITSQIFKNTEFIFWTQFF